MLPPGRRRGVAATTAPLYLTLALVLLFITTVNAAGSVLGIDFGTLNLKAVLVKPGIPLEIVLTKDSKRKEVSAVAFKPNRDSQSNVVAKIGTFPERLYGGDALALQGRIPGEVFPNLKPLLGLAWHDGSNEAIEMYKERYPAIQLEQAVDKGTTVFHSSAFAAEEIPWSVEELLAMELVNIKRNAEAMAGKGNSVDDVVITIPPFYTADERRAIERAARVAELDVHALISDGLAVGMDYAKSRTFPEVTKGEKPEYHIVYDMGAGSTTATLLRFQSRSVKDVGRFNKTVQEVAVLGTGWDRMLGGDSLTNVILTDYIYKFLTKPAMKSRGITSEEIKSNGRVMSRLWKEADKARQVLSANTETSSSFEELLPDVDFRVKLTRSEFENIASEFANRVTEPIKSALSAAKMDMKDIDSIILHGGAVRTPFVQKKLEDIAGGSSKLRSNVNADESAVFGAAFKGAGLSPSFKVKEIRDSDIAGYAAGMMYTDGEKERRQVLFNALSPVGHGATTKQVSFKDKDDFHFALYQQIGEVDRPVTRVETVNLTGGVKQLKSKFGCEREEVSTKFNVKMNAMDGLPTVLSGSVSCEVEGDGKSESLGDSVKDWLGFGKKKDQAPLQDGGEEDGVTENVEATTSTTSPESVEPSGSSTSISSSKVPEKPKKRTESVGIDFKIIPQGNLQPGPEELHRMRERLAAFDRSDQARVAREEALNVLESYTYHARDFLGNSEYEAVSTASQRDAISSLLASTREFIENPKEIGTATKESLTEKLQALKSLVEPIKARRQEELVRPEKVGMLRTSLEQTERLVEMVREQVQKAEEAKKRAEEWDASQAASAAESVTLDAASSSATPAQAADDLAELEEPDGISAPEGETPTTEPVPKYSSAADFSPYTNVDLTELNNVHASVSAWLEEKEAAQAKLKPFEEPVLLVKDIEKKAGELTDIMRDLLYKKMNAPPKPSKSKSSKTPKTKSNKKGKKTSASADDVEQPTAAEESPAFVTLNPGEDMPSQEEILKMVSAATEKQKKESSSSTRTRDEL